MGGKPLELHQRTNDRSAGDGQQARFNRPFEEKPPVPRILRRRVTVHRSDQVVADVGETVTRLAPLMMTPSWPLPLMAAVPLALNTTPSALIYTGPLQVPLILICVFGKTLGARVASESLREQLILRAVRNCDQSGADRQAKTMADDSRSRERTNMDCLLE